MVNREGFKALIQSRRDLPAVQIQPDNTNQAAEGGCGVIGMACSLQIPGRHLLQSLIQMRNRGNGKGGGVAAVGLNPDEFGVSREILDEDYLLAVAYLDLSVRADVERKYINRVFDTDHVRRQPTAGDYHGFESLEVQPPEVYQYFVRVKPEVREQFEAKYPGNLTPHQIEDEIVYQNSFRLNSEYYAAGHDTRAFVLSHGKNLLVLKMVGYGDDVVRYYQLENIHSHVWIGHHRYPTKGRVWHPGGAHPFVGLNEALVHNGDFANYSSIVEYLAQRNISPLFLTDTEVSVLVFDLLHRVYGYPLEYVIESLAPTTERDFSMLPAEKQRIYSALQQTHIHASPDGPWFFLIAQSDQESTGQPPQLRKVYRLTGITDTSMLRPQVFAWQQAGEGFPSIGFAASEKQAIDAALSSLSSEDPRFWDRADRYWNARGGSYTDGGAFVFSVYPDPSGEDAEAQMICTDKFGKRIESESNQLPIFPADHLDMPDVVIPDLPAQDLYLWVLANLKTWSYSHVLSFNRALLHRIKTSGSFGTALEVLTMLVDHAYPTGSLRKSSLISIWGKGIKDILYAGSKAGSGDLLLITEWLDQVPLGVANQTIIIDAYKFSIEGKKSLASFLVKLFKSGYAKFIIFDVRGHRFIGSGFGPNGHPVRMDVYGSPGDYLASGIEGIDIYVHNHGQDQLAQIMKSGKLVVHGDVGQTFMYAAKGGQAYISGNAAGRPLINAVGKPRVVINGTCLDYLAESFMAGDPHNGGGFVILNGVAFTENGTIMDLESPYPGGNLFSLASGGAIFIRDPLQQVGEDQLNGGVFSEFTLDDWNLIKPYLEENERLFHIPISRLLNINGEVQPPERIYRKITPKTVRALQAEETWISGHRR